MKIKTHIKSILIIVFCGISLSGFSQFTFGPKVGVNFSNFVDKTSMNAGIDAGIFLRVGSSFYFQPEVYYSFSSSSLKEAWNEVENMSKIKTHSLIIPLMVGYKFVNNPNFNFRLFLGPRLGLMIDDNYDKDTNPLGTVQLGGRCGLGFDFWRFTLDAGYDFSVNQPNPDYSSNTWWKQNMISISLGFKILKR
ncbi:MAG: PorT family protein [Bacteroidales bacterium]|jgi:hypothetical protein|nr:PorT family protein [Bacteroidales bacterium]